MACPNPTPTATLFGTSLSTTSSVTTAISTELEPITSDRLVTITSCSPTTTGTTTTCVPTTFTTLSGTTITSTILHTTLRTVSVINTFTTPTQTLFAPCTTTNPPPTPDPPAPETSSTTTTTPDNSDENTSDNRPSSSSLSTTSYLAPVTITRTFTSTDPNGDVHISTSASVSTPVASETGGGGSGGPNTAAIVGGVVGGVVGLIALIGIIWYIMWRRRSGHWDDIWEEENAHGAGAAEGKPAGKLGGPTADDNGSSTTPYKYGVVGRDTPSPLLRTGNHSHSQSVSTGNMSISGYPDHGRSNSQTPLMSATSPPHSPPNSPPTLQPTQLPGAGGLERTRTPVWASPAAQQGYFQQGYPPIPSDPNFTPTATSTYSTTSRTTSVTASSAHGLLNSHIPPTHIASNPPVAYPPGAAPPAIGGRRYSNNTFNEHHKPLLEQSVQGVARPIPPRQQPMPSGSATNLMDAPVDNEAEFQAAIEASSTAAGSASVNALSTNRPRNEKSRLGVVNGPPTSPSAVLVAQDAGRATSPAPVEDAPPAYEQ